MAELFVALCAGFCFGNSFMHMMNKNSIPCIATFLLGFTDIIALFAML